MHSSVTILDVFERQATRLAERACFAVKRNGRYVGTTWRDVARRVAAFSAGLVDIGLRPRQTIALLSGNRPEFIVADLAALGAGGVTVPIYPSNTPDQIAHIAGHCEAELLIAESVEHLERLIKVKQAVPQLRSVILIEGDRVHAPWPVLRFLEVIHRGLDANTATRSLRDQARNGLTADDLATIIYTSGTTGTPKGAMITHGNILSVCEAMRTFESDQRDDHVHLSFLPLAHALERMAGEFYAIYRGARIAYAESYNTLAENLVEVAPTNIVGVPRLYEKAYGRIMALVEASSPLKRRLFDWAIETGRRFHRARSTGARVGLGLGLQRLLATVLVYQRIKSAFGGRAQFCFSGGAPLSPEINDFFNSIGLPLLEGYGATETCGPAVMNPPERPRTGTVGIPLPGLEVKIAEDGEILIKGGGVFAGYLKDSNATAEALRDGWYHTGDLGRLDEEGYLVITERKKDIIVTSAGKKIAPQGIETRLKATPFIQEALLFGDRRNYLTALVTLNDDAVLAYAIERGRPVDTSTPLAHQDWVLELVEAEVARVNSMLASYQQVKRFKILDRDFSMALGELTPTLKARRRVIAERHAELIESMYSRD